jgi:hypothetical protein
MWAQLVKMRLKPGKDMTQMNEQIKAAEQPGSGLVRTLIMHDQKDPGQVYVRVSVLNRGAADPALAAGPS